jgi:hypothetical protein
VRINNRFPHNQEMTISGGRYAVGPFATEVFTIRAEPLDRSLGYSGPNGPPPGHARVQVEAFDTTMRLKSRTYELYIQERQTGTVELDCSSFPPFNYRQLRPPCVP